MEGFDDAEIARAIALSLQDEQAPAPVVQPQAEIPELGDEDEDPEFKAQLRRAIAESEATMVVRQPAVNQHTAPDERPYPPMQAAVPHSGSPFLMDRAEMERQRLERQKRKRPDIARVENIIPKREEDDDMIIDGDAVRETKRQHVSSPAATARTNASSSSQPPRSAIARSQPQTHRNKEELFYDGEIRQTANKYVDPPKDTHPVFRLSEILSPKDDIAFAIISAYVINFPWMYTFFEPKTPVIVVTQDMHGQETIKEVLPEWIKTTPFLRGGHGCMHMKFMLIFYKTGRLRVVVSTANLIEHDWRDIENSVWVQDIPARANPLAHDPKADDFPSIMVRILRSVNVAPALITLMRNGHNLPLRRLEELREKWDFSRVTVKLVPSLSGKHEGWASVLKNGHTALMKAIIDLKIRAPPGQELVLECQGSSIGTYTTQWMNEFYICAQGESPKTWLDKTRASRAKLPYPPIKILFPTKYTVRNTVLGEAGGGTMFCRRTQWEAAKFPRELFYDSKSKRGRVLMHSKMVLGTFRPSPLSNTASRTRTQARDDDDDIVEIPPPSADCVGWAYVGSHNFTPSAWGTLSGSGFTPVLNVTNFELGIVIPLRDEEHLSNVICWERPPKKYAGKDEPWFQSESPFLVDE
ncbi:tyrosyl-DNA phosphodiesterase-domain-containing protein [Irpex rosettiformis]|uniref:Tyrosyl-DNA phosphodiesterase-domain-containing protein n=1 Tax=Irpex rosettiformis TaxID=378272 RepID=A0ACB8U074_9APHY|nr:tyrosyl-DNA phosphodiesterase-domain-containing protein [Irpex rosettiformis]